MKFKSYGSGSDGNCYLIQSDKTKVVVDCGIAAKKIPKADGVIITHNHIDHIRSLASMENVYLTPTLFFYLDCEEAKIYDSVFSIGDIQITPFKLSHDSVDSNGFVLENEGKRIAIVTDTGYIPDIEQIKDVDLLIIEANYDEVLIDESDYSFDLIERIKSPKGHLGNRQTAEYIKEVLDFGRCKKVLLCHLSKETNDLVTAINTITGILFDYGYVNGVNYYLRALPRTSESEEVEL